MRAVVGKRPVRGPLDDADGGILFFDTRKYRFEVVDPYAKMIEPAAVAGPAPIKSHADVSIAGYDGTIEGAGTSFRSKNLIPKRPAALGFLRW